MRGRRARILREYGIGSSCLRVCIGWSRMTWPRNPNAPVYHGTAGAYAHGCRCCECREAMNEAARRRRERKKPPEAPRDESWRGQAACKGKPTDWWFALPKSPQLKLAVEVCGACPVQAECASHAMNAGEVGLWGNAYRAPWSSTHGPNSNRARWHTLEASGRASLEREVAVLEADLRDIARLLESSK